MRHLHLGLCLLLATGTGCTGLSSHPGSPQERAPAAQDPSDTAPVGPVNLALIKEPTPRQEAPSRFGNPQTYAVNGRQYQVLASAKGYREKGIASWYGSKFHGRRTSSGEDYDMYAYSAAHRNLPLPTYVRVTNLVNNRSVIVKVNDRGPFHDNRIIDLSYVAALKLDMVASGTALVEIQTLDPLSPAPASVTVNPTGTAAVFIQVGAFTVPANARALSTRLQHQGIDPVQIRSPTIPEDSWYRVIIGPLASVAQSDDLVNRLKTLGIYDVRVLVD